MAGSSMGRGGGLGGEQRGQRDVRRPTTGAAGTPGGALGVSPRDRCDAVRTTSRGRTERVARAAWTVLAQGELPAGWRAALETLRARRAAPGERAARDRVRQLIGLTPRELSACLRLVAVVRRVCVPDMQLKRVAFELGFRDPAALSRFVSRYVGVSPSALRRRLGADEGRAIGAGASPSSPLPVRQSSTA